MADKKPDPKQTASNSVIFIVMGVILGLIFLQNFLESHSAQVSFSYQLEHLVNEEMLQPEESRKTASANNLVTFSGRFREALTEEGKLRYKYLETLDANHELALQKKQLEDELLIQKKHVQDAAKLFLKISGTSAPKGFQVVGEIYNVPDHEMKVVATPDSDKNFHSLKDVEEKLKSDKSEASLAAARKDLGAIVEALRTPLLGIGNEAMKVKLRNIQQSLQSNTSDTQAVVNELKNICNQLAEQKNQVALSQLRSVRRYKETLQEYSQLLQKIEDNQVALGKARESVSSVIWFFNNQELSTRQLEKQDPEAFHQWFVNARDEWLAFPSNKGAAFKAPDQPVNKVLEKTFKSEELAPNYLSSLLSIAPIFLILLLVYFAFARQMKGMGGSALDFGKSPAKLYPKGSTKVTFKDVAGIEESLEELEEIVSFLKNPQKFTSLGGRIPKGVLCIGPPGTGKTLVAKAVAGEADCPFFSISGSDFVEMFVGVGASRIRKMFEEAKRNAPCIIFMDEIDAVGRHRGAGMGGGHDEREQTLNQLLVEMDGFDTTEGIIIIAATNRPDVLDKALLRPGRFDRQVYISLPDIKGRFEILKLHAKKIKLSDDVDLMAVARSTSGSSGADLSNLLNEAALLAVRNNHQVVTNADVSEARDKVLYGKERRSMKLDEQEKRTTAYHESGHAVIGAHLEHSETIDKVTIVPRGFALGATMILPKKDRVNYWRKELLDQLVMLMGGRAAEEIFVGDISSGAKNDIERATNLVRCMVCEWGMSDLLGTVALDERSSSGQYLGASNYKEKLYSEKTAQEIDKEVRRLLDEAYQRALQMIRLHRETVELMTNMLMEFETLDAKDVEKIIAGTWDSAAKKASIIPPAPPAASGATPPPPPPLDEKESPIKPVMQVGAS